MATIMDENPHNKLFQIQPILKERKLDPNNTVEKKLPLLGYALNTIDWLIPSLLMKNLPQNVHVETNTQSSTFW